MTVREDLITAALALASDKGYSIRERTEASRTATFFLAYEESAEAERAAGYVESDREVEEIRDEINTEHQRAKWAAEACQGVIPVGRNDCMCSTEGEDALQVLVDIDPNAEAFAVSKYTWSGGHRFSFNHFKGPRVAVPLHRMNLDEAVQFVRGLRSEPDMVIYALEESAKSVRVGGYRMLLGGTQ